MGAVDGVQVADAAQLVGELAPGHLQDLVGQVALNDLDKVLHLVPVELQLMELHRAAHALDQRCTITTQIDTLPVRRHLGSHLFTD